MKLLIDACLSPRLAAKIDNLFATCTHVFDCGAIADDDLLIWNYAKVERLRDPHKGQRLHAHECCIPPKVVWLRVGNAGTDAIADLVIRKISDVAKFETDPGAALLIIDI